MKTEHYVKIHEQYVRWLDILGFSDATINGCNRNIKDFFEYLENQNILSITDLTQKHIYTYFEYLQTRPNKLYKGTGLSPTHLNHNFDAIDKLCEFLHQSGMEAAPIATNFRVKIDKEERIRNINPFTQEEIKILYNCIEKIHPRRPFRERQMQQYETKLIFALLYGCGLRRTEAYNLQIQDVDFDKKTIFIKQGKGYKDRIIPMSASVYRDLQDYIYNFRHTLKPNHNRLIFSTDQMLRLRLKQLQKACNNEKTPHASYTSAFHRHAFIAKRNEH